MHLTCISLAQSFAHCSQAEGSPSLGDGNGDGEAGGDTHVVNVGKRHPSKMLEAVAIEVSL